MIVIIIVSWNVRDLLSACLDSLKQHAATTHPQVVVVVDNASSDGTVDMIRTQYQDILVVANPTNRGFTGGNNDGLMAAESRLTDSIPDKTYYFLLNPDTIVNAGALDAMLGFADDNTDVGLVGPQLLYADGSIQSSRRRFLDLTTAIFESTWLQSAAPAGLIDTFYMRGMPDNHICDVDWVYGAAMLVRRSTYLQCGGLDEKTFFMYSEEMDWCKRIKSTQIVDNDTGSPTWRVVYFPLAQITHLEAQSSTQVSTKRAIYFNTSKVRYMRKHHGIVTAGFLRCILLTLFLEQLIVESMKWLLGHKRSLRSQRIRTYVAVLKSGLV